VHDPCVSKEHVEAAKLVHGSIDNAFGVFLFRNIRGDSDSLRRIWVCLFDLIDGFLRSIGLYVGRDDVCTFGSKQEGRLKANTAVGWVSRVLVNDEINRRGAYPPAPVIIATLFASFPGMTNDLCEISSGRRQIRDGKR
jgi:hypothetical protein